MIRVFPHIGLALLVACLAGCNLTMDPDDHPYAGRGQALDADGSADARPDTADADDATDTTDADDTDDVSGEDASSGKPYLIFTELMPDVSTPPDEGTEFGEYIEIKNIGTAPADPRLILIQLSGSDRRIQVDPFPSQGRERAVFDSLQPIPPGGYFVFVRQDTSYYKLTEKLKDGTYYEYGRWFDAVPLANASRRLQLSYQTAPFHVVEHDAIEWASHKLIDPTGNSAGSLPMREDVAWGLQARYEDVDDNNDPVHWCYHTTELVGSPVKASPGMPTPSDCTRE